MREIPANRRCPSRSRPVAVEHGAGRDRFVLQADDAAARFRRCVVNRMAGRAISIVPVIRVSLLRRRYRRDEHADLAGCWSIAAAPSCCTWRASPIAARRCRPARARRRRIRDAPAVSVVRPVCGIDNYVEETLRSTFRLDYPNYEILFCVASARDPVVPLVERLIADFPGARAPADRRRPRQRQSEAQQRREGLARREASAGSSSRIPTC